MSAGTGAGAGADIGAGAARAAWALADEGTRRQAAATLLTLDHMETVRRIAARYANLAAPQRAGHLFEAMHELSFNQQAALAGSRTRAVVTEWAPGGSQTAAADLWITGPGGVRGAVQAKLMDRAAPTAHQLARPGYRGMQRLVAADRLDPVGDLMERRLHLSPDGPRFDDYADARSLLTDRITADGVHGDPVTYAQAQRAAQDPVRWAHEQVLRTAGREAARAAVIGAGTGAAIGAVGQLVVQTARVRAGETSPAAAVVTGAAAVGRAALQAGALSGTTSLVRSAARGGILPKALGGGSPASAIVQGSLAVGEAGIDLARGDIGGGEFAARSAGAVVSTTLTWGCAAMGQTLLPVPVLGALVGGLIGQVVAAVVVQGLQAAVVAGRAEGLDTEVLNRELLTAALTGGLFGWAVADLGADEVVCPRLAGIQDVLGSPDPTGALASLAELTGLVGRQDVFDRWMREEEPLVLDPNW